MIQVLCCIFRCCAKLNGVTVSQIKPKNGLEQVSSATQNFSWRIMRADHARVVGLHDSERSTIQFFFSAGVAAMAVLCHA